MAGQDDLTVADVRAAARLAGLSLDHERAAKLLPQLAGILKAINDPGLDAELRGIEPLTTFSLESYAAERSDA